MTGESGICTYYYYCRNVAHGVHIGNCLDRFLIGSCCKTPSIGEFKGSKSTSASTTKKAQTDLEAIKEFIQVESTGEVTASEVRPKQESEKISIPVKSNFSSNINVHNNQDKAFTVTAKYPEVSSSPNTISVLEGSLTTDSSTNRIEFYNHSFTEPEISNAATLSTAFVSSSTIKDVYSTSANVPQFDSSKSVSSVERDTVQMYNYENSQGPTEEFTLDSFSESALKNPLTVIPEAYNSTASFLLKDTAKYFYQLDQNSPGVKLPSTHYFTYEFLNKKKNATNNESNLFTTIEHSSALFPQDQALSFTPSHLSFSISHNESNAETLNLPYSSVNETNLVTNTTVLPSVEDSAKTDKLVIVSKYIDSLYPRFNPIPAVEKPVTNKPTPVCMECSAQNTTKICGRSQRRSTARIIGGRRSRVLKWPWMISLRYLEIDVFNHICGAVLLKENWAITAAHCIHGRMEKNILLRLGDFNFKRRDKFYPYIERSIHTVLIHPDFYLDGFQNDLALLRFNEPVRFQANIVPICLPKPTDEIEGKLGIVTGWGKHTPDGEFSSILHEAYVPIIANRICEDMFRKGGYFERIADTFVCAGVSRGGLDACTGDSGGPLMLRGDQGQYFLAGIVSWGFGCAKPNTPGVYMRITQYLDWIHESTVY